MHASGAFAAHRRSGKNQEIATRETEIANSRAFEIEKVLSIVDAWPRRTRRRGEPANDELAFSPRVRRHDKLEHASPSVDHRSAQSEKHASARRDRQPFDVEAVVL